MNDITIVCCYNDPKQYNELVSQLNEQSVIPQIIGIDNTDNAYSSCSKAFNSVLDNIKTQYVAFSHQDMIFESPDVIKNFAIHLSRISESDLLGVAGVKANDKSTFSNIYDGLENKKIVGKSRIQDMEECETFDECFFGGYSSYFKNNPFSEDICNNWHLYAVEQCLRARVLGGKVYVCDTDMYHHSNGVHNEKLHDNFRALSKAYHKKYNYICTTCCRGYTDFIRRHWGHYARNMKIGIKPQNAFIRKALNYLRKKSKKNKTLHNFLYGTGFFK
ncbi:glycosyltransferase [Butyrivibrio sp. VCD2006]|uniref:glycosyltransferase n=1 Tax=Butyrivibrio sp. VCD2006 TaxID=1280664 RepID=UPI00041BF5FD|nr:glycosyltransferase [Butyrivibrio sp. VCD2006]